jgi:hypothetical protein
MKLIIKNPLLGIFYLDLVDEYLEVWLSVTVFLHVATLLLVLDHENLWSSSDNFYSPFYLCACDKWSANNGICTIISKENLFKRDSVALLEVPLYLQTRDIAYHQS